MRYQIIRVYEDNGAYITQTESADDLPAILRGVSLYIACNDMEFVTVFDAKTGKRVFDWEKD